MDMGAKISTLLDELRASYARDPTAKTVVLSAWERMLAFVSEALTKEGIAHAALRSKVCLW
jgi:hypothetical protein